MNMDEECTTSKLGQLHLGSGGGTKDEQPTTPPPAPILSKKGLELRSATKEFTYSTEKDFEEQDTSEAYESDDERSSSSSLFTGLCTDIEPVFHNGVFHHRSKDFDKPLYVSDEQDEQEVRDIKKKRGVKDDKEILKSLEKYKREYIQTKRTYNNLDDLKEDKKEYEDLWQVRTMGKDEVLQKIDEIFINRDLEANGEHGKSFKLEKERQVVFVEELQCYVLKGKSTYICEYDNRQSTKIFARIDLLLRLIYRLLKADMTLNIRKIPYMYEEMFTDIIEVQNALDHICKGIGCTRDSLNIFASARGRIAGDISFSYKVKNPKLRKARNYTTNCQAGTGIEPRDVGRELKFDKLNKEKLLLILVVEKETIFQRLLEEKFHKRFHCIIFTGCGVPTVAARMLLNKMQKELDLPVVFLGDNNAGGLKICSNYFCGSKNMAYDAVNLCTPSIEWLGLSPSDLTEHEIPTGNEEVRGLEIIKKLKFVEESPELTEEVGNMKTKVDVDVMARQYLKYLTEVYLPTKFHQLGSG